MQLPYVPFEIIELFFDHLHHDVDALSASSLVCRGWHPSVRQRLFRKITLADREPHGIKAFCDYLQFTADRDPLRVEELALLPRQVPRRALFVTVHASELDLVVSRLPFLRILRLEQVHLQPSSHRLQSWSSPRALKELIIITVAVEPKVPKIPSDDPTDIRTGFVQLLNMFQSIDYLHLRSLDWPSLDSNRSPDYDDRLLLIADAQMVSGKLVIRKLGVDYDGGGDVSLILIKDSFLKTVQDLDFVGNCIDPTLYVHAAEKTLRRVSLLLTINYTEAARGMSVSFSGIVSFIYY